MKNMNRTGLGSTTFPVGIFLLVCLGFFTYLRFNHSSLVKILAIFVSTQRRYFSACLVFNMPNFN